MKVITRAFLALTAFSLAGIVQAGNASGQSYINYFVAGSTYNSGLPEYPSVPGQPGLKLTNFHSGITLAFNALKGYARPDSSGVYSLAYLPPPANASLAGIAKFTNRDYDTAFGGVVK